MQHRCLKLACLRCGRHVRPLGQCRSLEWRVKNKKKGIKRISLPPFLNLSLTVGQSMDLTRWRMTGRWPRQREGEAGRWPWRPIGLGQWPDEKLLTAIARETDGSQAMAKIEGSDATDSGLLAASRVKGPLNKWSRGNFLFYPRGRRGSGLRPVAAMRGKTPPRSRSWSTKTFHLLGSVTRRGRVGAAAMRETTLGISADGGREVYGLTNYL